MPYIVLVLTLLFSVPFIPSAGAEEVSAMELQRMKDNMERLRRDLNLMQQQFYRGDKIERSASPVASMPKNAAQLEVRLTELEEQIRAMNGRMEQTEFSIRQFAEKIDKIAADLEYRLQAIENRAQAPADKTASPEVGTGTEDNALVRFFNKTVNTPEEPEKAATAEKEQDTEEKKDAAKEFAIAQGLLRQAKYDKAEKAFEKFLQDFPKDKQAAEARYWLGEVYMLQKDYARAAVQFLKAYQQEPKGGKAPDSLLKLGASLGKTGKAKEGCTTLDKLRKEFPQMSLELKQQTAAERAALQCANG